LHFGGATGGELQDLYRAWVRYLFLIVEMQSAFENDLLYLRLQTTAVEQPAQLTALKLMMFENTHGRFVELYYKGLAGGSATDLWRRSVSLCDPTGDLQRLDRELLDSLAGGEATLERVRQGLHGLVAVARTGSPEDHGQWEDARSSIDELAAADRRFLAAMKATIRTGIQTFEDHEMNVIERGPEILAALLDIRGAVDDYHRQVEAVAFAETDAVTARRSEQ
jgi:hypothetical protein